MKKMFVIFFISFLLNPLLADDQVIKFYSQFGFLKISKDMIEYSIINKSGKEKLEMTEQNNVTFLNINKEKYLFLSSDMFVYLFNSQNQLFFGGFTGSGKALEGLQFPYSIVSTSSLNESGHVYESDNLKKISPGQPWVEGVSDAGIGQKIKFTWKDNGFGGIWGIVFSNGFVSYDKPYLYTKNNRVKTIRINCTEFPESIEYGIQDTPNPQLLLFPNEVYEIEIEILDVYYGNTWNDTCINFVIGFNNVLSGQLGK